MNSTNEMTVSFCALPQNESFARMVISAFISQTNPTLEEVSDVKTAVSEAVTNSIIHGYENSEGIITIHSKIDCRNVYIEVIDSGKGILDIKQAMEPMFTTKPMEDRSGMGFSFMEAFMNKVEVESEYGFGTKVKLWKEIGALVHPYE